MKALYFSCLNLSRDTVLDTTLNSKKQIEFTSQISVYFDYQAYLSGDSNNSLCSLVQYANTTSPLHALKVFSDKSTHLTFRINRQKW